MTDALTIDPEFERLIPPLAPHELAALEASIVEAGRALSPIIVWRPRKGPPVIVDGHNRYRICARLGLPFEVEERPFKGREHAREWMVKFQAARRALTRPQLLVLAVSRGVEPDAKANTAHEIDLARAMVGAGYADQILSGSMSWRQAVRRLKPPAPPKGPAQSPHAIPEGHELAGLSTLTGPDGERRGAWAKTRVMGAPHAPHDPLPADHHITRRSTMLRGDGSTLVQWVSVEADKAAREAALIDAMAKHVESYRGLVAVTPPPAHTSADLVNVFPLGDPHLGMHAWAQEAGEHFDLHIAARDLVACVDLLVECSPAAETAVIVNLGDFAHANDPTQRTPGHGHKLDVDGRHAKVLETCFAVTRRLIEGALRKSKRVHFFNVPGNHDPDVAVVIAAWLRAVFEREPRVTIEPAYAAIQYFEFGRTLLGFAHGDAAKPHELPALMADDRPDAWGRATERVWHTGHVHHKNEWEFPGCRVYSHRTLAAKDAYHAKRYRAGRSLDSITYHREFGQVSTCTQSIARVRAALEEKERTPTK